MLNPKHIFTPFYVAYVLDEHILLYFSPAIRFLDFSDCDVFHLVLAKELTCLID